MSEYLIHHGTKGMKWGIRKYQNADGSLTTAGKQRYGGGSIAGGVNRLGAKISSVNERYYKKKADKLYSYAKAERGIAGANRRVKNEHLRKADEARARGGIGGHLSSAGHRVAAKVYESNEKWWDKEAAADSAKAKKNRLREGMNRSARKSFEKQAEREDARANQKAADIQRNKESAKRAKTGEDAVSRILGINERHYQKKADKYSSYGKTERELARLNKSAKEQFTRRAAESKAKGGIRGALGSIGNKAMAKTYETNERYWNKAADRDYRKAQKNRTYASMNRAARKQRSR